MSIANVSLSPQELELVADSGLLLMKRGVIDKACLLLGDLAPEIDRLLGEALVAYGVAPLAPKVSKGESYRLLPYVVLDHPRNFEGESTFSIRTLFWWGHFFSVSLHLSGKYKRQFVELLDAGSKVLPASYFLCVNQKPWEHYFEPDNFISVEKLSREELMKFAREHAFLRIAKRFPLTEWDNMRSLMIGEYKMLGALLS